MFYGTVRTTLCLTVFVFIEVACDQNNRSIGLGKVIQLDQGLNKILSKDAKLEKLSGGFGLLEGPVWSPNESLLFSDMRSHLIYQWRPDTGLSVYPAKLGFAIGKDAQYYPPGPNGLAFDKEGRLTICEHGNRRVTRIEKNGSLTVLAERYLGKRLNSPNDLVYRSDGLLYFTDPLSGLGKNADSQRELPFSGIFLLSERGLELASDELINPNGLAFSPDEKYLYVGSDNERKPIITRYEVLPNGALSRAEVFFKAASATKAEWLDGMKVDIEGNLYVSASSGIIIISPTGKHVGTVQGPEKPLNLAWGGVDWKTLYITAERGLYRLHLNIPGARPTSTG